MWMWILPGVKVSLFSFSWLIRWQGSRCPPILDIQPHLLSPVYPAHTSSPAPCTEHTPAWTWSPATALKPQGKSAQNHTTYFWGAFTMYLAKNRGKKCLKIILIWYFVQKIAWEAYSVCFGLLQSHFEIFMSGHKILKKTVFHCKLGQKLEKYRLQQI